MKLHLSFLFLVSLVLFSCEPAIKGNERSFVKGTVSDFEGNAITNVSVTARTQNLLLGEGSTDSNGNFEFTSLQSRFSEFTVDVNAENDNSPFGMYSIIYSEKPLQQSYNLSNIILRKKATLVFNIKKTSTENNTLDWSLQYTEPNCDVYDDEETNESLGRCYETSSFEGTLDNTNPDFEAEFPSLQNTTVQFTYQLNDTEPQTISIELTEATNFYEFEY